MHRRRVKITGIGPVTPAGVGRAEFYKGINECISRVRPITRFDPQAGPFVGAEIPNFDLRKYAPDEPTKRVPRHTQFALAGTILALEDAGIPIEQLKGCKLAIVTGTTMMDCESVGKTIEVVTKRGPRYGLVTSVNQALSIAVADKIARFVDTPSRILALQSACCSGLDAIAQGAEYIANNEADFVICGGTEAPLYYHPMLELAMAEMSPKTDEDADKLCRPFDLWRTTGVIGEGACMFILEPEESLRTGYCFITGHGSANDYSDQIGSGWVDSIRTALANARRSPSQIQYISAWGPGHRVIDYKEAYSLKKVFGDQLATIPVSSIKGAIGSAMAAAGAIQVASTALTLLAGVVPPTVNWETPDPSCPLALSSQLRRIPISIALVNGHGISGSNSSIVLERL